MKMFKVICPVHDEHTPGMCSLYAGIEIHESDERGTPPHAVLDGEQKCRCHLEQIPFQFPPDNPKPKK